MGQSLRKWPHSSYKNASRLSLVMWCSIQNNIPIIIILKLISNSVIKKIWLVLNIVYIRSRVFLLKDPFLWVHVISSNSTFEADVPNSEEHKNRPHYQDNNSSCA